jgi:ubiquinone biosynthesis protein COQ4
MTLDDKNRLDILALIPRANRTEIIPIVSEKKFSMATPFFAMRAALSLHAAFKALRDPARQDMVAILGETTGLEQITRIRNRMLQDPQGRRILQKRPIIHTSTIDFKRLSQLPSNTFGYKFNEFMEKNEISVDTRLDVKYIGNEELAYVMTRYRQVHDFWHLLVEMPITLEAEVGLKLFEFFQTGLPMNFLSAVFGPIRLTKEQREILIRDYIPWAIQCANSSVDLMNVMYEDHFERDFHEFQRELGIPKFPF